MNDNKRIDRAITLILAAIIVVMVVTCSTGNAQMAGAEPEQVQIANAELIMACWVTTEEDTTEECVTMPNTRGLNESQVIEVCEQVKRDVKVVVPDAIITKCGLMRDWL
jgi:glycine cleavage system protein P-like pyridoxal-binding family